MRSVPREGVQVDRATAGLLEVAEIAEIAEIPSGFRGNRATRADRGSRGVFYLYTFTFIVYSRKYHE